MERRLVWLSRAGRDRKLVIFILHLGINCTECRYQEDTFAIGSLSIPISNLRLNLKDTDSKVALAWRSRDEDGESDDAVEQVLYAGVFDGYVPFTPNCL